MLKSRLLEDDIVLLCWEYGRSGFVGAYRRLFLNYLFEFGVVEFSSVVKTVSMYAGPKLPPLCVECGKMMLAFEMI